MASRRREREMRRERRYDRWRYVYLPLLALLVFAVLLVKASATGWKWLAALATVSGLVLVDRATRRL